MPRYRVDALEKFLVRTTYFVEATDERDAERLCREGKVAYESHQIEGGDDEWIETISIEPDEPMWLSVPFLTAHEGSA